MCFHKCYYINFTRQRENIVLCMEAERSDVAMKCYEITYPLETAIPVPIISALDVSSRLSAAVRTLAFVIAEPTKCNISPDWITMAIDQLLTLGHLMLIKGLGFAQHGKQITAMQNHLICIIICRLCVIAF